MALMKCPECGEKMSSRAKCCPHCGFPISGGGLEGGGASAPIFLSEQKRILYGLYPNRHVSDSELERALNSLAEEDKDPRNGWYLYRGKHYAKAIAKPLPLVSRYENLDYIQKGKAYWFLCEPIAWDVLSREGDKLFVLADDVLDAHRYDGQTSEYARSEIRAWLNGEFLQSAFALGSERILAFGRGESNDKSNGGFPKDKVFLPAYEDLSNPALGFEEGVYCEARKRKATDYARARGVDCLIGNCVSIDYGRYMTRSPGPYDGHIKFVEAGGYCHIKPVKREDLGVCPALIIKLP